MLLRSKRWLDCGGRCTLLRAVKLVSSAGCCCGQGVQLGLPGNRLLLGLCLLSLLRRWLQLRRRWLQLCLLPQRWLRLLHLLLLCPGRHMRSCRRGRCSGCGCCCCLGCWHLLGCC